MVSSVEIALMKAKGYVFFIITIHVVTRQVLLIFLQSVTMIGFFLLSNTIKFYVKRAPNKIHQPCHPTLFSH